MINGVNFRNLALAFNRGYFEFCCVYTPLLNSVSNKRHPVLFEDG